MLPEERGGGVYEKGKNADGCRVIQIFTMDESFESTWGGRFRQTEGGKGNEQKVHR